MKRARERLDTPSVSSIRDKR